MNLNVLKEELDHHSFTDEEVLDRTEELGQDFAQKITSTQFRKFYNQLRSLFRRAADLEPSQVRSELRILQAQVAYSAGRKQVTPKFKNFFDICSQKIYTAEEEATKEVENFLKFLESIYGYFYYYEKKK